MGGWRRQDQTLLGRCQVHVFVEIHRRCRRCHYSMDHSRKKRRPLDQIRLQRLGLTGFVLGLDFEAGDRVSVEKERHVHLLYHGCFVNV